MELNMSQILGEQWSSSHFFLYILPFFLLILLIVWFTKPYQQHIKYNIPPSPWKLPIIGNLHQLHELPHHALHSLAQKYGPLMLLHLGRVPTVVASSANMAREILITGDHVFSSRPDSTFPKRLLYGKDVAFAPYGEHWRQVRKICVLELLSAKKVQSFRVIREEEVALMMEKIKLLTCSSLSVNLDEMFFSLTNNVTCRAALGKTFDGKRFKEIIEEFSYFLAVFNVADFIPSLAWVNKFNGLNARLEKTFHELDSFLDGVIEEHICKQKTIDSSENKAEDFVDVLLRIEKESTVGFPFERDCVKAIVLDMFAAGTDTTSVVLIWAMSELLKHPEIMKEVQEEVRQIARGKAILTEDDHIEEMLYLKSVIKETLRFHPPGPLLIPHESIETTNIQGYNIPAKTTVIINAYSVGRDPMAWEEPDKFWPKRFMSGDASLIDFKGQQFELIPFGAGRRGCPGITFATSLVELALANLLNLFDWRLLDGMEPKDLNMDERPGLSIRRKTSLSVTATPHY